jgi:hypothetical protein
MDVFAHGLWTNAVFYPKYRRNKKQLLLSVFFGVVPDIISFAPLLVYSLLSGLQFGRGAFGDSAHWTVQYAVQSYNFGHSAVSFVVVLGIIFLFTRKIYWPLFAWLLHIVIDIFTHPEFFSTPFLYPLSNFKNHHGISWAHPTFMVINYALIIIVYILIFRYRDRKQVEAKS